MKKNNISFCMLLLVLFFLITSCNPGEKDYCGTTDKRFACTGYLGLDDNYIVFNKVPVGVYTLQKPYISYDDQQLEGGESPRKDCIRVMKESSSYNGIEKDKKYYFDCISKEPGRYTMDVKIMHSEPQSYKPVAGETCLLISQGYQNKWECTASAYYTITVK